jgi:hypothetical protein
MGEASALPAASSRQHRHPVADDDPQPPRLEVQTSVDVFVRCVFSFGGG